MSQGYARDVIQVVIDNEDSGDDDGDNTGTNNSTANASKAAIVDALLYRGTPDNPAMWPRALRDLPFAAGTYVVRHSISVSLVITVRLLLQRVCTAYLRMSFYLQQPLWRYRKDRVERTSST